jgi:hypothetical protein
VKKRADLPGTAGKTSASDADLFAREMADVVRLKTDPRGRVRTAPVINPPAQPDPPLTAVATKGNRTKRLPLRALTGAKSGN